MKKISVNYDQIKDMNFDQLAEKCFLESSESGRRNLITYYSAQKGG
jgi:hypothetical protein